jgi:hypothetical protein
MALWVFGPADCGVSISRLDTPPSCTIVFLAYTQNLGAIHTPLADAVDSCPKHNHGGWPVLQPPALLSFGSNALLGAAYAGPFLATARPAISLSVDVWYEMLVSFTLGYVDAL